MAEFYKECFKKHILTSKERNEIKDEQIIMHPVKDLCEGCGKLNLLLIM